MANRVFDRLARLDRARRRRARRRRCARSASRGIDAAMRARARAAVRAGAGDAGRPQGADHPRFLHPAAPSVPVRGQRGGALHGAGRAPRAQMLGGITLDGAARGRGRCAGERARPRAGQRRRGRRRRSRFPRHGAARRSTSASALDAWIDRGRRRRPARWRSCRARSASTPDDTRAGRRPRFFDGPL